MGKTKSAIFNAKGFLSLTFEVEAWRGCVCYPLLLGYLYHETGFGPGLLANVLIYKLGIVRVGNPWDGLVRIPPSRSIVGGKHPITRTYQRTTHSPNGYPYLGCLPAVRA